MFSNERFGLGYLLAGKSLPYTPIIVIRDNQTKGLGIVATEVLTLHPTARDFHS